MIFPDLLFFLLLFLPAVNEITSYTYTGVKLQPAVRASSSKSVLHLLNSEIRLAILSSFLYQLTITKLSQCVYFSQVLSYHCRRPLGFYLQCQVLSARSCPANRGHHQVSYPGILPPCSLGYGIEMFHISLQEGDQMPSPFGEGLVCF